MDKSADTVAVLHAVLRAGGAYVPIDTFAPAARVAHIVRDCSLELVVTGHQKRKKWAEVVADGIPPVHVLVATGPPPPSDAGSADDVTWPDALDRVTPRLDAREVAPDDLAYILYTSGSTGPPKGVQLSHRNALAFVAWAVSAFDVGPDDRLSSHAPFHFDLSIFDLYAAAWAGASVVLVPRSTSKFPAELVHFIDEQALTIWYSVPSALAMLTVHAGMQPGALPSLRTVLFAGEVFPSRHLSQFMHLVPHAECWNLYGPTETNVCTAYRVTAPPDPDTPPIPIGRAIDGVRLAVIDDDGLPVEPGVEGELLVSGPTVTSGYWGDPARTAERLGPRAGDDGEWYRTGDRVRELPSGDLSFIGRRDHQIKSRGHRIELGEVEAALQRHPEVDECVVLAIPDDMVTNTLHAVVTPAGLDPAMLAAHCASLVPAYMVPEQFVSLDSMPRTSSGKIDRQHLTGLL